MWTAFPSSLFPPTFLSGRRWCSVWDGHLVSKLSSRAPSAHSLSTWLQLHVGPGHWVYSFCRKADGGKRGWDKHRASVPWARELMGAGFLFFAPWEAGGLADTNSQYRSWLWPENQANSHRSRKDERVWTSFNISKSIFPLGNRMNNNKKCQNKHFSLVFPNTKLLHNIDFFVCAVFSPGNTHASLKI